MWYLDCGNRPAAGQILLGSSLETDSEFYNFGGLGYTRMPSLMLLWGWGEVGLEGMDKVLGQDGRPAQITINQYEN
jgi:hypothetical protein